ncbi:hypothetical protein [Kibdelosporangium philippinense]|uniref:hypothetical protein n=1 Tax=Kibdelosporangium philippinense TaxID=211113 RepID=UPI0036208CD0
MQALGWGFPAERFAWAAISQPWSQVSEPCWCSGNTSTSRTSSAVCPSGLRHAQRS